MVSMLTSVDTQYTTSTLMMSAHLNVLGKKNPARSFTHLHHLNFQDKTQCSTWIVPLHMGFRIPVTRRLSADTVSSGASRRPLNWVSVNEGGGGALSRWGEAAGSPRSPPTRRRGRPVSAARVESCSRVSSSLRCYVTQTAAAASSSSSAPPSSSSLALGGFRT